MTGLTQVQGLEGSKVSLRGGSRSGVGGSCCVGNRVLDQQVAVRAHDKAAFGQGLPLVGLKGRGRLASLTGLDGNLDLLASLWVEHLSSGWSGLTTRRRWGNGALRLRLRLWLRLSEGGLLVKRGLLRLSLGLRLGLKLGLLPEGSLRLKLGLTWLLRLLLRLELLLLGLSELRLLLRLKLLGLRLVKGRLLRLKLLRLRLRLSEGWLLRLSRLSWL